MDRQAQAPDLQVVEGGRIPATVALPAAEPAHRVEYPESQMVTQTLASARRCAELAGDTEVRRRHLLYAMTLEPEPRELLASKRVDVVKLQRALFAEIYPKGQRTDAETGKVPEFSSRLLALRLYAARAALSRKSPTSEIIDLLEAFKFESLEQRTGPSPISGVLRDAWDEATYVDATLLGSELARTLLQSQQEERKKLLEKMDALEKQLMQRGLLARIFGGHR